MTTYTVLIDRMTVDLFEYWLSPFWAEAFLPRAMQLPIALPILSPPPRDRDAEDPEHIYIGKQDAGASVRITFVRFRYETFFIIGEFQASEGYQPIGYVLARQKLTDQIHVTFGPLPQNKSNDDDWLVQLARRISVLYGIAPTEADSIESATPLLKWLLDSELKAIAYGGGTIRERTQKIDDFTISSLGIKLGDAEIAEWLASTPATIHGYRKPL